MIVTIDGPAGTGKSTAARLLAERLGFSYLDTGAMYRAVALACLEQGTDPADAASAAVAGAIDLQMLPGRTLLAGRDVTELIRTVEVTAAASVVAQNEDVRQRLVDLQRRVAAQGDFVCEGRDQGTVAFPAAECKFFLTADPRIRAERRRQELAEKGVDVDLEELLQQQQERDRRDQERSVAPLRPADDAILIDTSHLGMEEVLQQLEGRVRAVIPRSTTP